MVLEYLSELFQIFIEMFQRGGIITYVIAFIAIYGILTSLQKIRYLRSISKTDTTEIMGAVTHAMNRGGVVEALKSISHYKNPVSKIISEALKIGYKNKTEVEEGMEQVFIVELSKMTRGLDTVKTIIELAPFVGLIGTVIGIWMTFKSLGIQPDPATMAEGIYIALSTSILGLGTAIMLLPIHNYLKNLIDLEMDKIELANKMTNWNYGLAKIRVDGDVFCAIEALKEAPGIVNTKEILENDINGANIRVSFKPSMLEKSIKNIILEKCETNSEITQSILRQ